MPNDVEKKDDADTKIQYPIDAIELSLPSQAMPVGGEFHISADISPSYTDDHIIWASTDKDVLTVDQNGNVTVVGVGTAGIMAKAANGSVSSVSSFKIMPEYDSNYSNICKSIADKAVLTIKNRCYNTFLGIPTKSKTKTFTATIFKSSGTTYHFITGYDNFKLIDGYDYQEWTAIDNNGKEYEINSIQYERDYSLGNDYRLAVGSINAYNLGVLSIESRGHYYDKERLYVKSGNSYTLCCKDGNESSVSPMNSDLPYKESLYGSPVLDCDYNFVGIIIRSGLEGNADFITTWKMKEFIESCGIDL